MENKGVLSTGWGMTGLILLLIGLALLIAGIALVVIQGSNIENYVWWLIGLGAILTLLGAIFLAVAFNKCHKGDCVKPMM